MAANRYSFIYEDLKEKIEKGTYTYQTLLPSENILTGLYQCSRNTVRRAISSLSENAYVQSIHGKGVTVIYEKRHATLFELGSIESLKEAAVRNNLTFTTKVIFFEELTVDAELHERTSFLSGSAIYYIQRVRYLENDAVIIDHNFLLKSAALGLTAEIAEKSIYEYLENELDTRIVTTKRKLTVERTNKIDKTYMNLNGYNCVSVVSSHTYNAEGVMFEYTESRHRADIFAFYDQAKRRK